MAPDMLAIIAKYTGLAGRDHQLGLPFCEPRPGSKSRTCFHDRLVLAAGILKAEIDGDQIIDKTLTSCRCRSGRWRRLNGPSASEISSLIMATNS